MLRGLGATVALPLLDAMTPALARAEVAAPPLLICLEQVHGAAGSSAFGQRSHLWAPAAVGTTFDLSPTALRALAPYRDALTIVSNTDVRMADPTTAREIGGDHFRSSAVFLTQARPKRTTGPDVEVGPSLDQLYARRFGQDTPIPSLQLCVEPVDTAGGCQYGYSCHYMDALSWSTPTTPLPMIRDPRVVFDRLFNVLGGGTSPAEQRRRRGRDRSILDWVLASTARLAADLGPGDRRRLDEYLNSVREVERRIQRVEAVNLAGDVRDLPGAPAGVPDSFVEHVRLMFDLQVVALRAGITRVVAFKLGRDGSNRVYPDSGVRGGFHSTSHHADREAQILELARINAYHVSLVAYLLDSARPDRRRRRLAARPCARPLRIADGRPQPAQPSQGAVPAGRPRRRPHPRRPSPARPRPDAAGQRDVVDPRDAGPRARPLRRQHRARRFERRRRGVVSASHGR